ncbi:BnaA09g00620D [Brassica napus]|uniref:BnaA09g00620D protein n=1 Tax=Brassica napus TaxID=3708 RepID=A0A078DH43_BRANA|nr:BnaCnng03940D [Brassica napus]CDY22033.1 BnaA09g00620D [Brassica napus]
MDGHFHLMFGRETLLNKERLNHRLRPQTNRWRDETQRRKIAKAFPIFPILVRRWRRIWLVRLNLERMNGFNPNKGWVFVEGEVSIAAR